jgi:tRNA splicing endonuclease
MSNLREKANGKSLRDIEKEDPALAERIFNEDPELYTELYNRQYGATDKQTVEQSINESGVIVVASDGNHHTINGYPVSQEMFEDLTRNQRYYLTGWDNLGKIQQATDLNALVEQNDFVEK